MAQADAIEHDDVEEWILTKHGLNLEDRLPLLQGCPMLIAELELATPSGRRREVARGAVYVRGSWRRVFARGRLSSTAHAGPASALIDGGEIRHLLVLSARHIGGGPLTADACGGALSEVKPDGGAWSGRRFSDASYRDFATADAALEAVATRPGAIAHS